MDKVSVHDGGIELSGHIIEAEGCFGAFAWNVCRDLYNRLPRDKRDPLLEATSLEVIRPFGVNLTHRLLVQAGNSGMSSDALDRSWSFETFSVTCAFGSVDWQISQGLWDAIPEDQRETLYGMAMEILHEFFGANVFVPLMVFAHREMGDPRV